MTHVNLDFTLSLQRKSTQGAFQLNVQATFPTSGVTAILGESGCGKTSLLRCIAGLEKNARGHISIDGKTWQDDKTFIAPHQREVGFVFQDARLFSHLNVEQNLAFAIKRSAQPVSAQFYQTVLDILGLSALLQNPSQTLSGGEKQRVAIARALLIQPTILLMDEPLASLDNARKQEVMPYLIRLHKEVSLPIVYVSHSMTEITKLADHLLIMEEGKVIKNGPIKAVLAEQHLPDMYRNETSTLITGTVRKRHKEWQLIEVEDKGNKFYLEDTGQKLEQELQLRIHANDISISLTPTNSQSSILNCFAATISEIEIDENKSSALVRAKANQTAFVAAITKKSIADLGLQENMKVWLQIKSVAILA